MLLRGPRTRSAARAVGHSGLDGADGFWRHGARDHAPTPSRRPASRTGPPVSAYAGLALRTVIGAVYLFVRWRRGPRDGEDAAPADSAA